MDLQLISVGGSIVSLPPDERQRIYLEEKTRIEAQEQIKREAKQKQTQQGCIGCLGFLAIVAIVVMIINSSGGSSKSISSGSSSPSQPSSASSNSSSPATTASTPSSTMHDGTLSIPGGGSILIAVDEQSFDALVKASVAKDTYGIAELILAGKLFEVNSPVKVKLLDAGFTKSRVRIMEGPKAGMAGWVPTEWVR